VVFGGRSRAQGEWQICVTDIVKDGWYYDPFQNNQTCETVIVP